MLVALPVVLGGCCGAVVVVVVVGGDQALHPKAGRPHGEPKVARLRVKHATRPDARGPGRMRAEQSKRCERQAETEAGIHKDAGDPQAAE